MEDYLNIIYECSIAFGRFSEAVRNIRYDYEVIPEKLGNCAQKREDNRGRRKTVRVNNKTRARAPPERVI